LAILFDIPIEVSTDIVSLLSLAIGVISFMDITNSIGGLGVLGGRAFVRKRNSIAYQEFKLNNKRPGFESRNPIIFQKEMNLCPKKKLLANVHYVAGIICHYNKAT